MASSENPAQLPAAHLGRLCGRALLATAALAALGAYPTFLTIGAAGLSVMGLALGIALAGSLLGIVVTLKFPVRHPADVVSAVLGGLGVRFAVTLLPVAGLALAQTAPALPLLIWIGLGKFTLLGLDVVGLMRAMQPERREAGGPSLALAGATR